MDELTLGDKTYISSKYAAKITGYAKDYVGQLCREGRVDARLVGRNWYVLESSIREHRFGKEPSLEVLDGEAPPSLISTWEAPTYTSEPQAPVLPSISAVQGPPEPIESPNTTQVASDMQSAWKEWFDTRGNPLPAAGEELPEAARMAPEAVSDIRSDAVVTADQEIADSSDITNIEAIFGGPLVPHKREESLISEEGESEMGEEEHVSLHRAQERQLTPVIPSLPHMRTSRGIVDLSSPPRVSAGTESRSSVRSARPMDRMAAPARSSAAVNAILLSIAGLSIVIMLIGSGIADSFAEERGFGGGFQNPILNLLQGESVYDSK